MQKTHGMSQTILYRRWADMKKRCTNPNYKYYSRYKDRFYEPWNEFISFMEWALANGYFEGASIDRRDNSKGYSPSNCQWLTWDEHKKKTRTDNKLESECKRGHDVSISGSRYKNGTCKKCSRLVNKRYYQDSKKEIH